MYSTHCSEKSSKATWCGYGTLIGGGGDKLGDGANHDRAVPRTWSGGPGKAAGEGSSELGLERAIWFLSGEGLWVEGRARIMA